MKAPVETQVPAIPCQTPLQDQLAHWIHLLSHEFGARNVHSAQRYANLTRARDLIGDALRATGHPVTLQPYLARGRLVENIALEIRGQDPHAGVVVMGAHYDTVRHSPGANDNGSGVACLLAMARLFTDLKPRRTLRLVAFTNEEPPFTASPRNGQLGLREALRSAWRADRSHVEP